MSKYRHGRQPLPVVGFGGIGNRIVTGRVSGNESVGNTNHRGAKKSSDNAEDDDELALRMAYISSRHPEDPKRKRKAMISHGGKLTAEEAMAINLGVPPKPNIGNDEGVF